VGPLDPADLAFIRLKANGEVLHESILEHDRKAKSAIDLSEKAWARLEKLLLHYRDPQTGYLSRALPFREAEVDGEYDHLARVLEWSAGGPGESDE
jgi:ATP-dependent helicase/nuclease subunit B